MTFRLASNNGAKSDFMLGWHVVDFTFQLRSSFPFFDNHPGKIYLDNGATTQKPSSVIAAVSKYFEKNCTNVHRGGYQLSDETTTEFENARKVAADFIGAKLAREIVFTHGTTASLNLLAHSLLSAAPRNTRVIVSAMEHHSNLLPWRKACERAGATLDVVDITPDGLIDLDHFASLLKFAPAVVSLTACSNVLGVETQLNEIAKQTHNAGAILILDAAQLVLHRRIDVKDIDCDFLVFSGHKIFGPTGIGVLYGKENLLDKLMPYQYGGEMVEEVADDGITLKEAPWKFEAGTPPIAEALGLAAALEFHKNIDDKWLRDHSMQLAARMFDILGESNDFVVYGSTDAKQRFGPITFNLGGVHYHDLAAVLDAHGVMARSGSHCAHPLMRRLGAQGSLRISFAPYNSLDELEVVRTALKKAVSIFKRSRG